MSKINKCPYCGKRISYAATFSSRRKAEYVCPRCEKESRVVINKAVIPVFIAFAVLSVAIMALWIFFGLAGNLLGIVPVAAPLIIFVLISPKFVRFEPLKKYKKSMEAKKAGIVYSDNLMISEMDDDLGSGVSDNSGQFQINSELFNQIRAERNASRTFESGNNELKSTSDELKEEEGAEIPESRSKYVHLIDDVRERHSGSSAPLKKLHSDTGRSARARHYIEPVEEAPVYDPEDDDVKEYKRSDGNKYSANRRF